MHSLLTVARFEIEPYLNRFQNVVQTQGYLPFNQHTQLALHPKFISYCCYHVFAQYLLHYYSGIRGEFNAIETLNNCLLDNDVREDEIPCLEYNIEDLSLFIASLTDLLEQTRCNVANYFDYQSDRFKDEMLEILDISVETNLRTTVTFIFDLEYIEENWGFSAPVKYRQRRPRVTSR